MNKSATFDPAKRLDLYFRINRNGSKDFIFTSGGSPYSLVYETFQLNIKDYAGDKLNKIQLTIGAGLTITTNTLRATITAAQSNICNEGEYYWELYRPDIGKTWLSGNAHFHSGEFDGLSNDDSDITISDTTSTVTISINDSVTITGLTGLDDGNATTYDGVTRAVNFGGTLSADATILGNNQNIAFGTTLSRLQTFQLDLTDGANDNHVDFWGNYFGVNIGNGSATFQVVYDTAQPTEAGGSFYVISDGIEWGKGFGSSKLGVNIFTGTALSGSISRLNIDRTGAWNLASNPGTSGQVIASAGPGLPPIWQSSGGLSGLTANRIPYAASPTSLSDSANFTWDNTNKALTINSNRIHATGIQSLFFGEGAGNFSSLGSAIGFNIGIGYHALTSLTSTAVSYESSNNTVVGSNAGVALTKGNANTFVGSFAGATATIPLGWSLFGSFAGNAATSTITTLDAFGYNSGLRLTTGDLNCMFGKNTGVQLTSGNHNNLFGFNVGASLVTGARNTAMGSESIEAATGSEIAAFGYYAGLGDITGTGNTYIGCNSGYGALGTNANVSGIGNTFLGNQAAPGSTTQISYSTAIGAGSTVLNTRAMQFGSKDSLYRPNYGFGGESFGGGFGVLYIANYTTIPTAAPTGGFFFYSDAGVAKLWNTGGGAPITIGAGGGGGITDLTGDVTASGSGSVVATIKTSVALAGSPTTTTQSAGDNSTKIATTAYCDNLSISAFSTTVNGYVLASGAATSLLLGNNTWLALGSAYNQLRVNSAGTALEYFNPGRYIINTQTASYAPVAGDVGKLVEMNVGSGNNVTINTGIFVAGDRVDFVQFGAGQVTFVAGSGTTINSDGGRLKINARYGAASIICRGSEVFYLVGDISA